MFIILEGCFVCKSEAEMLICVCVCTWSQVYLVPETPASSWLLPDVASSQGSRDSCLLPGCHEWAEAEWEGAPLHLDTRQHDTLRDSSNTWHIHAITSHRYSHNKGWSELVQHFLKRCNSEMEFRKESSSSQLEKKQANAYVWVRPEGCRRQSVSCGCRGSWAPPGERWSRSCRSRCCPRPPRRGWCWHWGCWGGHRSPGRATRGPWRRSPWWCWAPQTAEVWGRCLEAGRGQNALVGQEEWESVSGVTVRSHFYTHILH